MLAVEVLGIAENLMIEIARSIEMHMTIITRIQIPSLIIESYFRYVNNIFNTNCPHKQCNYDITARQSLLEDDLFNH